MPDPKKTFQSPRKLGYKFQSIVIQICQVALLQKRPPCLLTLLSHYTSIRYHQPITDINKVRSTNADVCIQRDRIRQSEQTGCQIHSLHNTDFQGLACMEVQQQPLQAGCRTHLVGWWIRSREALAQAGGRASLAQAGGRARSRSLDLGCRWPSEGRGAGGPRSLRDALTRLSWPRRASSEVVVNQHAGPANKRE